MTSDFVGTTINILSKYIIRITESGGRETFISSTSESIIIIMFSLGSIDPKC